MKESARFCCDVERLLNQHVQSLTGRRNPLFGMQAGRAADHHQVKRPMLKQLRQGFVNPAAEAIREARCPFVVLPIDGRDLNAIRFLRRARVSLANVPTTNNTNVYHRQEFLISACRG